MGPEPAEADEVVRGEAFSKTIGRLPDFIEKKMISPVDGLYVMQVFMQYRTGDSHLSLVKGRLGIEKKATSQEWGLIRLLFSRALKKPVIN